MKALHMVAYVLLWIGGINWGLVGLGTLVSGANWNVVTWLAGYAGGSSVEAVVYVLVGISAVWLLVTHGKHCKECTAGGSM
ncbi:MAG: DUF378 domain-containing protein [Patescibacteria group bacterium]